MTHPWFLLEQEQGDIGLNQLLCTRRERSVHCVGGVPNHFPQGIPGATGVPGLQEWLDTAKERSSIPGQLHAESPAAALQRCPRTPPLLWRPSQAMQRRMPRAEDLRSDPENSCLPKLASAACQVHP